MLNYMEDSTYNTNIIASKNYIYYYPIHVYLKRQCSPY